jgi:hypothetical protein
MVPFRQSNPLGATWTPNFFLGQFFIRRSMDFHTYQYNLLRHHSSRLGVLCAPEACTVTRGWNYLMFHFNLVGRLQTSKEDLGRFLDPYFLAIDSATI